MSQKTLVVHSGGVGDFICALPALKALALANRIEIAGIPERAALAVHAGIASAAHSLDAIGFHTVFSTPSPRLSEFCLQFDRAFVFMNDDDQRIQLGLTEAGIPSVRCYAGIPPASWDSSAALWYADCLGVSLELPFALPKQPQGEQHDILIHPGSGDPKKNWPLAHFLSLSRKLESSGRRVTWCTGPAECGNEIPWKALTPMPLLDLSHLLSNCNCFVGNDSGISHLASVSGCPTVAIFGPTRPSVWSPIGPRTHVLAGSPWPASGDVESAIEAALRSSGPL